MKFEEKYDTARPYAASYCILRKGNLVAFVLRKNTGYMDGYYGLPSGKVEYGEPYSAGVIREAKEEAGVDIDPQHVTFVHMIHRHAEKDDAFMDWVDVYFEVATWEGEPYNAEPEKSEKLAWLDINKLPNNIVPPVLHGLQKIAAGERYSEFGWNVSTSA